MKCTFCGKEITGGYQCETTLKVVCLACNLKFMDFCSHKWYQDGVHEHRLWGDAVKEEIKEE